MKESKKSNNLNECIDKETEKRFNEELNEIKEKLNSEKLSDEFKSNLQIKLQEELNKTEESTKSKIFKFPVITRKLAGICACFIFLFSSCFAFADDIENVILEIFGKTDSIVEKAIAEGNYRKIDMEYVEDNGVSIKVDYVVIEDNEMYIAFNVLGEKYYKIFLSDICIKTKNNTVLYSSNKKEENSKLISDINYIYDNNMVIIYKLTETKFNLRELTGLNIEISKIDYIKDNIVEYKSGKWFFDIKFDG